MPMFLSPQRGVCLIIGGSGFRNKVRDRIYRLMLCRVVPV